MRWLGNCVLSSFGGWLSPNQKSHLLLEREDPGYIKTIAMGKMEEKLQRARQELEISCKACPRECGVVDRRKNESKAMCGIGQLRVSAAFPHGGEEPALQADWGSSPSGTIFFTGCNMRCVFCQNWHVSWHQSIPSLSSLSSSSSSLSSLSSSSSSLSSLSSSSSSSSSFPSTLSSHSIAETILKESQESWYSKKSWVVTEKDVAELMVRLQDEHGCGNINFVTPEHVGPYLVGSIAEAFEMGLRVPIIYNTSSYDSLESLRLMEGLVDVYLPDFKFWNPETAQRLARTSDYPQVARESIREMHRQVGPLTFCQETGAAVRGVLLRHLVMPNLADEGVAIVNWVAEHLGPDTYLHIMDQYHPDHLVGQSSRRDPSLLRYAEINRPISTQEWEIVETAARNVGLWRFAHE